MLVEDVFDIELRLPILGDPCVDGGVEANEARQFQVSSDEAYELEK
jgi:hypothetical protein